MPDTAAQTQRSVLSYSFIKNETRWSAAMVEDYQAIFQDWTLTANKSDVLEAGIQTNAANIQTNADNFTDHDTSNSEHGVLGINVGTEDFCTELIGGVVLLSQLVNDAVDSTQAIVLADIAVAPAAYSQAYTQTLADMANDTKAKHNQLVIDLNASIAQINDLLDKLKTAKQMNTV